MSQKEIVDLTVWMVESAETDRAIKVYDGATKRIPNPTGGTPVEILIEYWLPKSLVEHDPTGNRIDADTVEVIVSAPRWLLEEKGLV